jgi:hypothetical protein
LSQSGRRLQAFDTYKEGLVKDLLDDCWKKARGEEPLPDLRPSIIPNDANKPIVESGKGNEKGKEKTEQKPKEKAIARKATVGRHKLERFIALSRTASFVHFSANSQAVASWWRWAVVARIVPCDALRLATSRSIT